MIGSCRLRYIRIGSTSAHSSSGSRQIGGSGARSYFGSPIARLPHVGMRRHRASLQIDSYRPDENVGLIRLLLTGTRLGCPGACDDDVGADLTGLESNGPSSARLRVQTPGPPRCRLAESSLVPLDLGWSSTEVPDAVGGTIASDRDCRAGGNR